MSVRICFCNDPHSIFCLNVKIDEGFVVLEKGYGACFSHQLKRCNGVCAGGEAPELHFLRLKQALIPLRLKSWPYPGQIGIREYCKSSGRAQLHVFDYWCHLGTVDNECDLDELLAMKFDVDTYKLLLKNLGKQVSVMPLGPSKLIPELEKFTCA